MSTHSTKWNRMTVNEPLRRAIQYVKETYYLSGVKLTPNIPKSVKSVYRKKKLHIGNYQTKNSTQLHL
jgi:hypothetical protein